MSLLLSGTAVDTVSARARAESEESVVVRNIVLVKTNKEESTNEY